jgi:addiction module RelE/StbE family toxin
VKVFWTPEALRDRSDIWAYIEAENPDAAARMDQLFSDTAARLADFPMMGHPGEIAGTRELTPHRNYRLIYETHEGIVWILALIHAARRWPPVRILGPQPD